MPSLAPIPKFRAFTAGSALSPALPLVGGKLYAYAAGTTTPKDTYTDAGGLTANTNPVILDARGEADVWLGPGAYKFVLQNALGVQQWAVDNIKSADQLSAESAAYTNALRSDLANNTDPAKGPALVGFSPALPYAQGTVGRKLREHASIDDYASLAAAFTALGGSEGTGYGAAPVTLDLLGQTITLTANVALPTNVSLVNGTITSPTYRFIQRNPFLANTGLRGYTEYWPFMTAWHQGVTFNCRFILSCYIAGKARGARFTGCDFTGTNGALVLVNSNTLWTEYNLFDGCSFSSSTADGAAILFDGNLSGSSTYSTGSGVGTSDGSFGYNKFTNCKIDSTAPAVGLKLTDGATLYNAPLSFSGYARGAGGGFLYVANAANASKVSQCEFSVHLESFGAASNWLSLDAGAMFWYNVGSVQTASPQITAIQNATADVRTNAIQVTGVVLHDKAGTPIFNGDTYVSTMVSHALRRLTYFSGDALTTDTLTAVTSVASPSVVATAAGTGLRSLVTNYGDIVHKPDDPRSVNSRNWKLMVNAITFGDWVLKTSTTNLNDPSVSVFQVTSSGQTYNLTGTYGTISDARLKENISDARSYYADFMRIRVRKYSLIEQHRSEADMLGVIAQELEPIFPGMVETIWNEEEQREEKRVKTSVFIPIMMKTMQEIAAKVEAIEAREV